MIKKYELSIRIILKLFLTQINVEEKVIEKNSFVFVGWAALP